MITVPAPDSRRLGSFFGILVLAAATISVALRVTEYGLTTLTSVYMFSPLVAGAVVCVVHGISFRAVGFRFGRARWLLAAVLIALPLVGLTFLIAIGVPGVGYNPTADPLPGVPLPGGGLGVLAMFGLILAVGSTVNAVFAFGEEFGWRGYLLWELAPWGFWPATVSIGGVWGLWHAPIIVAGYNFPSYPLVGVVVMTVAGIALSPVYTYLVIRAESVVAAALLHGVFNGSAGLVIAFAVAEGSLRRELIASPVGLAGIVAFGLAAVLIAVRGAPELSRNRLFDSSER